MRIFVVDAFTSRPFAGNPAAVCLVEGERDDAWRQAVAAEMNLSETAFLERGGEGRFGLRWFTPRVEVDLCGHATLASAHVLWEEVGEEAGVLRFFTRSGTLAAERSGGAILLDFPADPPAPVEAPPGLAQALGCEPVWTGRGRSDLFVEVADEAVVPQLAPDFGALRAFDARAVIVTAAAKPGAGTGADFVSRVFAPRTGIDEDPVTGSAHCTLACFWGGRLGRGELRGYQASARGGYVGMRLAGDRVVLSGSAVTVVRGELA